MTEFPKKRRGVRFKPDKLAYAVVMYRTGGAFDPDDIGLILDEAAKGAQVAVKVHPELAVGLRLTVKLGRLAPLEATVIWIKEVDTDLRRLGLEFVDARA